MSLGQGLRALSPEQVLVVYNSEEADSLEVANHYQAARPGVLAFDLADSSLLPGTISYADFIAKIRDPLRTFLNGNNLQSSVVVLVLTKGIPHRIQQLDTSDPDLGDRPIPASTAYNDGDLTYASVDSELTLLQFDLDVGESGGSMDSPADRAVYNPYFGETASIDSFDRSEIDSPDREFYPDETVYGWWRRYTMRSFGPFTQREGPMDPGHIYLTARLDANTVLDVKTMIDRAASIMIRRQTDALLFDQSPLSQDPFQIYNHPLTGGEIDDYAEADSLFAATWSRFQWNQGSAFFSGETNSFTFSGTEIPVSGPVAHLNSYGVNHSGSGERNYLLSYEGQLVPGASFAAYESYGAAGLGGVTPPLNQAQIAEWIGSGGTFATGPVWEPFTFGISRSAIFLDRFFNRGLTYVEAAWSSIMQLSWQSVVLGDPLATATVIDAEPYYQWTLDNLGTTPTVSEAARVDGDFEEDRVTNGVEYSFDLNPMVFSEDPLAAPERTPDDKASLTFIVPDSAPMGVTYRLEKSLTLESSSWSVIASWNETTGATGTATIDVSPMAGGTVLTITDPESLTAGSRAFYRLSVVF